MVSVRRFTPSRDQSSGRWCRHHQEIDDTRGHKRQRGQGDTNTQYNRQTTALHSSSLWRSHTNGCRRGMQLQCSVVWDCSSLLLAHGLAFSLVAIKMPRFGDFCHAVSEPGLTSQKEIHLGSGLNQRDEAAHGFFCYKTARVPEAKKNDRGCPTTTSREVDAKDSAGH